jgi:hypothetical protein
MGELISMYKLNNNYLEGRRCRGNISRIKKENSILLIFFPYLEHIPSKY